MSSQVFSVNGLVPADGTVEELVKLGKKGSYREDALEGTIAPFELSSPVSRPPELSSFVPLHVHTTMLSLATDPGTMCCPNMG